MLMFKMKRKKRERHCIDHLSQLLAMTHESDQLIIKISKTLPVHTQD